MRHRRGFTMIELMAVIVIMAILVGLLVPAVGMATRKAKNAAVAAEIRTMSQALASFHSQYGCYPPSRIVIAEDGDYSEANVGKTLYPLSNRSMSALRRIWPRLTLRSDGTKPAIPKGFYDVNGDHIKNEPYVMFGEECLVFFLGGITVQGKDGFGVSGFDKTPGNPFTSPIEPGKDQNWPFGSSRTAPEMNFNEARLFPTANSTMPTGAGPLLCFYDSLGTKRPYAYFSSYEGSGYDPDDVNIPEPDIDGTVNPVLGGMQSNNNPLGVTKTTRADIFASPSPNPYLNDSPLPLTSTDTLDLTNSGTKKYSFLQASTFQIISAGYDGLYGIGGHWNPKDPVTVVPFYAAANATATKQTLSLQARQVELDNVANFASSTLQ